MTHRIYPPFFFGSWFRDSRIMQLNAEERGTLHHVYGLMFQEPCYGWLNLNNQPYPYRSIAKELCLTKNRLTKIIETLLELGLLRLGDNGFIYSQEMIDAGRGKDD